MCTYMCGLKQRRRKMETIGVKSVGSWKVNEILKFKIQIYPTMYQKPRSIHQGKKACTDVISLCIVKFGQPVRTQGPKADI